MPRGKLRRGVSVITIGHHVNGYLRPRSKLRREAIVQSFVLIIDISEKGGMFTESLKEAFA
jgi:hypothetical protein